MTDTFSMPASFSPSVPSDNNTAIVLARMEVALANEKVRRTELALAAFQHTSTLLQQEASRTRVSARCAWAAVAVLSVGVYVAVGWTASKLTEFRILNATLTQQLRSATDETVQKASDVERFRTQSEQAKQAAARVEGELSVAKARRAATQPSFF